MIKEILCKLNLHRLEKRVHKFDIEDRLVTTKICFWCGSWVGKKE